MLYASFIGTSPTDLLLYLVYAALVFILIIIMLSVFDKILKFFTFRYSPLKVQRGELIKKKMFKCSDLYELKWNGEINEKGTHIVIYVHDMIGDRTDANAMSDWFFKNHSEVSVVSYDQRWYGENIIVKDRSYGANLSDLKEIISDLHEKFADQKIVLVGHGFGANLAIACASEDGVFKVIAGSLKVIKGYKNRAAARMGIFWSWIFNAKSLIDYRFDAADLTDDIEFVKVLQKRRELNGVMSVREYFQTRYLLTVGLRKYQKHQLKNLTILQPDKSMYSRADKFTKKIGKLDNIEIEVIKDSKHHLFNTKNDQNVFEVIYKKIC